MSYELLQQGPAAYIPLFFIFLLITVVAYGAFPLIFARARKSTITKKKYNRLCYCINLLVMVLFIAINGEPSSGGAYLLWTWVFSSSGIKIMEKRCILEGTKPVKESFSDNIPEKAPSETLQSSEKLLYCRKCGYKLHDDSNFCSKCGTPIYPDEETVVSNSSLETNIKEEHEEVSLNKDSRRTDPWEDTPPTPKKIFTKKAVFLAFIILLIVTVGFILFTRNNGQSDYYYDSTYDGNAPSADSVDPYDEKHYDVRKIRISADSSSGVGDVYSTRIEHQDYHIYDNQIGQVYDVNYKIIGGVGQTGVSNIGGYLLPVYGQTNDWWYCVVLPDGTTGFVWGGTDGMYVDEIG